MPASFLASIYASSNCSMACFVSAAGVGRNRTRRFPSASTSKITLSSVLYCPPYSYPAIDIIISCRRRMSASRKSMVSYPKWIAFRASLYPAISASLWLSGALFWLTIAAIRLSLVTIPSMALELLMDWIFATASNSVKTAWCSSLRTPAIVFSDAILEVKFTRFAGSKPLFKKE